MLFLEQTLAIFKRLTGYPLDANGVPRRDPKTNLPVNRSLIGPPNMHAVDRQWDEVRGQWIDVPPRLPSYGIRVPMALTENQGRRPVAVDDPAARVKAYAGNSFRQVPVYEMNVSGKSWDNVYPSVTFRWTTFEPGRDVPYHEPFVEADPSATLVVRDEDGEIVTQGSPYALVRPSPAQVNVTFMITCWSSDAAELGFMCANVLELFPAKTALIIELQNGEEHGCDMLLDRIVSYDDGGDLIMATHTDGAAPFSKAFYYTVEGYLDNTTNEFGVQAYPSAARRERTIVETILEISDLQSQLILDTSSITAEAP